MPCRKKCRRPSSKPRPAAAPSPPKWTAASNCSASSIDPEAVKSGDVEMLQDLVLAAVNEAARKVDAQMQSTVGGMLGGLGIPGL